MALPDKAEATLPVVHFTQPRAQFTLDFSVGKLFPVAGGIVVPHGLSPESDDSSCKTDLNTIMLETTVGILIERYQLSKHNFREVCMSTVKSLGFGIYQMELVPMDELYNTTGYLILGKKQNAIVETGASRSNVVILNSLKELNISVDDIHAIIATHIHPDHAGGAGLLMGQCPNAIMYVHERGLPHLVAPGKLATASRAVYGESFDSYFHPIIPIPAERVQAVRDGDQLHFIDSPGHALHHMVVYDAETRGIFTGDAAGIYYPSLEREFGVRVALPSSTPTQFDPEDTLSTLNKMSDLKPQRLYYTHFGLGEPAGPLLDSTRSWLDLYRKECVAHYRKYSSLALLAEYLQEAVMKRLQKEGVTENPECLWYMKIDNQLNAQGLVAYCERLERQKKRKT